MRITVITMKLLGHIASMDMVTFEFLPLKSHHKIAYFRYRNLEFPIIIFLNLKLSFRNLKMLIILNTEASLFM